MRTRPKASLEDLRRAIDCLPRHTRVAMLEGIEANSIIVGAYATSDGICPMLAAHRAGGRTSAISFAHAWDRVAFRDAGSARARRATERELLILRSHLEASLLEDELPAAELARARHDHERLLAERERLADRERLSERERPLADRAPPPAADPRPGDRNRTSELRGRRGWAWTRVVRRYDDYERVLAHVQAAAARTPEPTPDGAEALTR